MHEYSGSSCPIPPTTLATPATAVSLLTSLLLSSIRYITSTDKSNALYDSMITHTQNQITTANDTRKAIENGTNQTGNYQAARADFARASAAAKKLKDAQSVNNWMVGRWSACLLNSTVLTSLIVASRDQHCAPLHSSQACCLLNFAYDLMSPIMQPLSIYITCEICLLVVTKCLYS